MKGMTFVFYPLIKDNTEERTEYALIRLIMGKF